MPSVAARSSSRHSCAANKHHGWRAEDDAGQAAPTRCAVKSPVRAPQHVEYLRAAVHNTLAKVNLFLTRPVHLIYSCAADPTPNPGQPPRPAGVLRGTQYEAHGSGGSSEAYPNFSNSHLSVKRTAFSRPGAHTESSQLVTALPHGAVRVSVRVGGVRAKRSTHGSRRGRAGAGQAKAAVGETAVTRVVRRARAVACVGGRQVLAFVCELLEARPAVGGVGVFKRAESVPVDRAFAVCTPTRDVAVRGSRRGNEASKTTRPQPRRSS